MGGDLVVYHFQTISIHKCARRQLPGTDFRENKLGFNERNSAHDTYDQYHE